MFNDEEKCTLARLEGNSCNRKLDDLLFDQLERTLEPTTNWRRDANRAVRSHQVPRVSWKGTLPTQEDVQRRGIL